MSELPENLTNVLLTGNARELIKQIPDESISMVFVDPIYENIEDYEWLGKEAMRVLKPDKSLLAWVSKPKEYLCVEAVRQSGLEYVYTLNYTVPAKMSRLMYYHLFIWTTPCLWFQKGRSLPYRWITDTAINQNPPDNGFKWNKNMDVVQKWLTAFTQKGDTVLDCFAGSGTVPVVCKITGRNYLAFEIDPIRAEAARQRILYTPVPMFIEDPVEQFKMDFDAIDESEEDIGIV